MFMGMSTQFFYGVVEDRMDDKQLGRLRVRIFGIHSELKVSSDTHGSPTEDLLWCYPMQPITSAAISGVGTSPTGIVEGTHVIGFFRDEYCQDGIIIGTIGGIPAQKAIKDRGFNDPNGVYPRYINEPDTNRLARGVSEGTIVDKKKETIDTMTKPDGSTIEEPPTPFAAKYPFNQVRETECGHVQEFDDTKDAERIQTYHKSGTFVEIHPDGTEVHKIIGNDFEIVHKNRNLYVKGDLNIHVMGNANLLVDGNTDMLVKGTANSIIEGAVTQKCNSTVTQTIEGDVTQTLNANEKSTIAGNLTVSVGGNYTLDVGGSIKRSGADITDDGGGASIKLAGSMTASASTIALN